MSRIEPILSDDDRRIWDMWMRTARVHARSRAFQRRVDAARRAAASALHASPNAVVAWSGGKDSTALVHLVGVEMGARVDVFSEKDDLDFPGEEDYVVALARAWDLPLSIVRPPVSPRRWLERHASDLAAGDDIHGRSAGLSATCFYPVVAAANEPYDALLIGLRAEESRGRRAHRASRGLVYRAGGKLRAQPIADWTGLDVYAYAESRGIDLLPMYRCVGLMHADEPWRLRKSWWVPGAAAATGQTAWLRRYYPSLYRTLLTMFPSASTMA